MIMLISLEYTLTQTRMFFGRVTLISKGPMRGKYVFIIENPKLFFIDFPFSVSVSEGSASVCLK